MRTVLLSLVIAAAFPSPGWTGQAQADLRLSDPQPPDTMSRDASGQLTLRAVRVAAPLEVDGQLDEAVYRETVPISGFIQSEPREGAPGTEKTELWIFFDDDNIYVSARMWESEPDNIVVNEMRRDGANMMENDQVAFILDTFHDRRNGVLFIMNAIGGKTDGQVTNERTYSRDWNTVWSQKASRFPGGWVTETAIPFKSLRYGPGRQQVWGFNARRIDRWKNELSHLTAVPSVLQTRGLWATSYAATLVGLEVPPGAKNLEIKPYLSSDVVTDRKATPIIANDTGADFGVDVKYGITQNLTADLTYNTDFAQVEADEQQVNLTRFSLFFPEKREFFLENAGLFSFGSNSVGGGASGDVPVLFYSRRIGLNQGRVVPIDAGGRLTGRLGRYSLGLVNIQAGDESVSRSRPTNFSVVRLRRDILGRSNVGLLATARSVSPGGTGSNQAYGVDGNFAFFDDLTISTYWARTHTDGLSNEDDVSYRAQLDFDADRYGLQLDHLVIGDNFNPEVGFVRRDDIRRLSGEARFSPRPKSTPAVRKFYWIVGGGYLENGAGRVEARNQGAEFTTEFETSDRVGVNYFNTFEYVPRPFRIASDVTVPVGGYDGSSVRLTYHIGTQRLFSGDLRAEYGTFYDGDKTSVSVGTGRANFGPRLSVEPNTSINWVNLPWGSFTSTVVSTRVIFTIAPEMFTTALVQYNSGNNTISSNARLRWEYRPGSELFVVYNEERDTFGQQFAGLANRSFIVKINRLLRF